MAQLGPTRTRKEFIRSIRLKRAASLMKQGYGNISEIAFEVGFNHLSYFTQCFRKEFGVNPKDFK
jgi:AraC-like DNA-binding protein